MKAQGFLDRKGISYRQIEQEKDTVDCEEAAAVRGLETRQIVKSLIVERNGEVVHACLPGDRTLSERKFGEHRMAEPKRSLELTGQESGTVHPFSSDLKHFVDFRVFLNDEVSHTTGTKTEAVQYSSEEFREALESSEFELETGDYVVSNSRDIEILEERGVEKEDARHISESGMMDLFLKLDGDQDLMLKMLKEAGRHEIAPEPGEAEKILSEAESETHLQKLVEQLAETGRIESSGDFELENVVETVVGENPEAIRDLRNGKDSAMNYLIGQVMSQTSGRADAGKTREMVQEKV